MFKYCGNWDVGLFLNSPSRSTTSCKLLFGYEDFYFPFTFSLFYENANNNASRYFDILNIVKQMLLAGSGDVNSSFHKKPSHFVQKCTFIV